MIVDSRFYQPSPTRGRFIVFKRFRYSNQYDCIRFVLKHEVLLKDLNNILNYIYLFILLAQVVRLPFIKALEIIEYMAVVFCIQTLQ